MLWNKLQQCWSKYVLYFTGFLFIFNDSHDGYNSPVLSDTQNIFRRVQCSCTSRFDFPQYNSKWPAETKEIILISYCFFYLFSIDYSLVTACMDDLYLSHHVQGLFSMRITRLRIESRKVCNKTMSSSATLLFNSQGTKHTTVTVC